MGCAVGRSTFELARVCGEVLGIDFQDSAPASWENHQRVIASIDTVKRPARMERLLNAPRFDLVIVDEAHHVAPASPTAAPGGRVSTTADDPLRPSVAEPAQASPSMAD